MGRQPAPQPPEPEVRPVVERAIGRRPGREAQLPTLGGVASAFEVTREELEEALGAEPAYRANQVWRGLWERGALPADMTDLPAQLRQRLSEWLVPALHEVTTSRSTDKRTTKWLWELGDGSRIETVLMLYRDRATVCISSQAGCAMGCSFCATGQGGFRRHLETGEIVEQVVAARRAALPRRLDNVVFMGMGEPMANYARVMAAVRRIHDLVPGIRQLAEEPLPVNLAVSLHAARDELRNQVVPLNRRYPLSVLMGACAQYVAAKNRRLSFEWALIDGVNDSARDAAELAELALPLRAHVNIIPLNPTQGYLGRGSAPDRVEWFRDQLKARGVNATVRANRGTDIDAACGQLAARDQAAKPSQAARHALSVKPDRGRQSPASRPVALRAKPVPH
jgi:23S rRNA (adenine2503-C2)-methyltransferase